MFTSFVLFSQNKKTCSTSDIDELIDLNSITKCTVKKVEESNSPGDVKIQVSARRRVVRKNQVRSLIEEEKKHELADLNIDSSIDKSLSLSNKDVKQVLFNAVDSSPLFTSCETKLVKDQKRCFHQNILSHVNSNLEYPTNSYNKGIQGKVLVQFIIDVNGKVKDLNAKGPYQGEELVTEAKRIINKLPTLIPAKHLGKPVEVVYALPITFSINTEANTASKKLITSGKVYSFDSLDAIPYFNSCKRKDESCFHNKLMQHINENFYYPEEAIDKNIQGRVMVNFTIDKEGDVLDIVAKGPVNGGILEEATISLFSMLPKLSPGIINGQKVNSEFSFPIDYNLN